MASPALGSIGYPQGSSGDPANGLAFTDTSGVSAGSVALASFTDPFTTLQLATGQLLVSDGFIAGSAIAMFNADGTLIVDLTSAFPNGVVGMTVNPAGTHFYVGVKPAGSGVQTITVRKYDATGAVVNSWDLSVNMNFRSPAITICVDADDTVLFYSILLNSGTFNGTIKRWDLVNNIALSDYVANANNQNFLSMFIISGSMVVEHFTTAGAHNIEVRDSSGTVTQTYVTGTSGSILMFPALETGTFWAKYNNSSPFLRRHDLVGGTAESFTPNLTPPPDYNFPEFVWRFEAPTCPDPCGDAGVGEPYWALAPEYNRTYFYDREFTSPPFSTVSTVGAVAIAPEGSGRVWIALDDVPNGTSILYLVDPSTIDDNTTEALIERVITEVHDEDGNKITIGELGGRHALFAFDCDQLITVDRATHDVIKICLPSEDDADQFAIVGQRYSLNINPLDAQLVDGGENLLYVDGASLKIYSLLNDIAVKTLYTGSSNLAWPVLLTDNSILARVYSSTPFRTNGDVVRISRTGTLLKTFSVDPALYTAGQYGIAGDIETDACSCGDATDGRVVLTGELGATAFPYAFSASLKDTTTISDSIQPGLHIAELSDITQGGVDTAAAFCAILGTTNGPSFSDQTGDNVDSQLSGRNRHTPNRHCGPEAGVSSPAPNPGCNAGGRGWTRAYTGASGSVPSASDPTGEENLTGERTAFIRVKVRHTDYGGTSPSEELLCVAKVDLPSNPDDLDLHPHAEARVLSIGDDDRGLSDGQGNMKSGSTHIQFMDSVGRPFGIRLTSPTNRFFTRDELVLEAVTPDGLREGRTPRRIGTGLVYGESYGGPVVFGLTAVDPLFIDGGSFGPDKRIPTWTYPLDFYTGAPPDLAQVVMPFYYGEKSDEGAVSLTTNQENSRGLCTARYVGTEDIGGESWGRFNVCLFAIYDILALYGSDLGGLGLYGDGATVSIIDPSDNPDPEITTEVTVVTLDGSPDLSGVATDGTMQIVLFSTAGRIESAIVGVDLAAPSVTIETAIDADLAAGVPWYISSIDYVPRRVKIDIASRQGVDVEVPHWSGFFRGQDYEDISTNQGIMRVTDLWAKGALLSAHLVGEVTLAVNLIGIEDKGNGTGLPITEYFTAFNHFIDNFVHVQRPIPDGAGSLWPQNSGQLPQFSDGVSKTKSSTFEAAQAITAHLLGGVGLQVNAGFTEPISVRDALQLWIDNGACKAGIDEYGRFYVWMLDRDQDTTTWPYLNHVSRVFGEPPTRSRALDEAFNWYRGGCDFDPEGGFYREDDLKSISEESISRNKGIPRQSKHYDLKLLGDTAHAQWVLDQNLLINRDGPNYIVIQGMDWGVLDYPIGSGIFFSSPMLPGVDANGMVDQPMVILDRNFDLDSGLATITCLDLEIVGLGGSPI